MATTVAGFITNGHKTVYHMPKHSHGDDKKPYWRFTEQKGAEGWVRGIYVHFDRSSKAELTFYEWEGDYWAKMSTFSINVT